MKSTISDPVPGRFLPLSHLATQQRAALCATVRPSNGGTERLQQFLESGVEGERLSA